MPTPSETAHGDPDVERYRPALALCQLVAIKNDQLGAWIEAAMGFVVASILMDHEDDELGAAGTLALYVNDAFNKLVDHFDGKPEEAEPEPERYAMPRWETGL